VNENDSNYILKDRKGVRTEDDSKRSSQTEALSLTIRTTTIIYNILWREARWLCEKWKDGHMVEKVKEWEV
jgi:hypothetical protein